MDTVTLWDDGPQETTQQVALGEQICVLGILAIIVIVMIRKLKSK